MGDQGRLFETWNLKCSKPRSYFIMTHTLLLLYSFLFIRILHILILAIYLLLLCACNWFFFVFAKKNYIFLWKRIIGMIFIFTYHPHPLDTFVVLLFNATFSYFLYNLKAHMCMYTMHRVYIIHIAKQEKMFGIHKVAKNVHSCNLSALSLYLTRESKLHKQF